MQRTVPFLLKPKIPQQWDQELMARIQLGFVTPSPATLLLAAHCPNPCPL